MGDQHIRQRPARWLLIVCSLVFLAGQQALAQEPLGPATAPGALLLPQPTREKSAKHP